MAIVAVSVSPVGEGVSLSEYVAEALKVLEERDDIEYEFGPMFTTIEGDPDVLFEVVRQMQEAIFEKGADRVGTIVKMDDRRDKTHKMNTKMESVQKKMQKSHEK